MLTLFSQARIEAPKFEFYNRKAGNPFKHIICMYADNNSGLSIGLVVL